MLAPGARPGIALVLAASVFGAVGGTAEPGPREAVDTFFRALNGNDAALAATVMMPDGMLTGLADGPEGVTVTRTRIADYLASMETRSVSVLERIWDVRVLEADRVATVWTPYDFWLEGRFHHCGVNAFSLVRADEGWKIAGVVYSIRTLDCPDSPLGLPDVD